MPVVVAIVGRDGHVAHLAVPIPVTPGLLDGLTPAAVITATTSDEG